MRVLVTALLVCACGRSVSPATPIADHQPAAPAPLERVALDDRPPLTLVARGGDPRPALAFVAAHSRGSAASAALAGVLAARLEAAGIVGVETRAHGLGIEVACLAAGPKDAERFVTAVRAAVATEVTLADPALRAARRQEEALFALRFAGPAQAAAAACSGELGVLPAASRVDLASRAGVAWLNQARAAIFRVEAAAFAALGPESFLDATRDALSDASAWPTGDADTDTWPEQDVVAVDPGGGNRQLSVAVWLANADAAVGAANALGSGESELRARLESLAPPWRLERATAIARQRGACLRLDVTPPPLDPGPSSGEVGRVAALVERSALLAVASAGRGALDESVLRPIDPRRSASLAAWRALPSGEQPGALRRTVAYVTGAGDSVATSELGRSVSDARVRLARPSIDVAEQAEPGQGELWMLLASPCGTGTESAQDAGALALLLRSSAISRPDPSVQLEPWVTPDGIGLLAHGPRSLSSEPPAVHARRVARALGRALVGRIGGAELGAARADLLTGLGGQPFVGFSLALEGLSPGHPSWLEPRGTWDSVSELPSEALERARRLWLGGPLRLSVLTNGGSGQSRAAVEELESWLLPLRAEVRACPIARAEPARRGEVRVDAKSAPNYEGAYVGVTLGSPGFVSARIAELLAFMLNRPGGLLERAVAVPGLGATVRAHALGGVRRPALLLDVRALPERLEEAVRRARAVFDSLSRGAFGGEDLASAQRELARREEEARFDPRRRIVELWRAEKAPALDLAAVRAALPALGSGSHWVVSVVPPP